MARNKELYKGRKKRRSWPRVVLIILLVLIVCCVTLFYSLQKYIVYTPNGLSLELPILATDTPTATGSVSTPAASGSVVIDKTDYKNLAATAGEGLDAMKAVLVPYSKISAADIENAGENLSGGNSMVLELKPAAGTLSWKSSVQTATSFGVNGTADIADAVKAVKAKNIWLVAQISMCVDSAMSSRNSAMALKTTDGKDYADGQGGWLDPYSQDTRTYIVALAKELTDMGFDEILLSNLAHPSTAVSGLAYASSDTEVTAFNAVTSLGLYLTQQLKSTGAVISVVEARDAISGTAGELNGQNTETLLKVFDRVYCYTDTENYKTYMDECGKYITKGDVKTRFVPICSGKVPQTDCWVLSGSGS